MAYDRAYFIKKAFALYPGVVRPRSAPVFAVHYAERRAARGAARALLDGAIGLGFLGWAGWRAASVARRFDLPPEWRRGAARTARAAFVDPNDLALFRLDDAAAVGGYIRRFEDAAINKRINPRGWTGDCVLVDKVRFADRCAEAGLPVPETVAVAHRGAVQGRVDPGGRFLLAKPVAGEGGDGLRVLGPVVDAAALAAALAAAYPRPQREPVLVQPVLAVHPDLRDLALAALPTVRIVTILNEQDAPELVSATFRCPSDPAARVDNMKAGGLIAAVDLDTGTLGVACRGYGGGDYPTHPATGAAIAGRALPDWPAATALARRAHEAFRDYALIGWDIAMTPDGPVLVEGNGKPGVLMPQRAARRGLADTRYGALLAYHLATKR